MTRLKCQICYNGSYYLAPKLIPSGYAAPKNLKCPFCETFYNSNGDIIEKEDDKKEPNQEQKINIIQQRTKKNYGY